MRGPPLLEFKPTLFKAASLRTLIIPNERSSTPGLKTGFLYCFDIKKRFIHSKLTGL